MRSSLLEGLRLSLLLRPRAGTRHAGWGTFALLGVLHVVAAAAYSRTWFDTDMEFNFDGIQSEGFDVLLTLLLAIALARLLRRPAHGLSLANLLLTALLVLEVAFGVLRENLLNELPDAIWYETQFWLWTAIVAAVATQCVRWLRSDLGVFRSIACGLAFALLNVLPWRVLAPNSFWTVAMDGSTQAPARAPSFDAERVMFEQAARVGAAVDALEPEQAGKTDLYLINFGGDGSESVFRNEVQYVESLFAQRFGAKGRVLTLLNHPKTTASTPLASASNLRYALKLLEGKLNPREDILMLFATSHGSEDHFLSVDLQPIALNPLSAVELGGMLRNSVFANQVIIVSACYSGGFLPALRRPGSLVITAARKDRASFGCGADSDITYFGRAYFANALNKTDSLIDAFALAKREVSKREAELDADPSEPQIASNAEIEAKLVEWRAGFVLGKPLEFIAP